MPLQKSATTGWAEHAPHCVSVRMGAWSSQEAQVPGYERHREWNFDFSVSCCALRSWRAADKLVLMAMGYKAILTAAPGRLSQRESSAFPKFYGLKLSGERGRAVMGSFFSLIQWPRCTFRKYQQLGTLRRRTEEPQINCQGLKSFIANDNSI